MGLGELGVAVGVLWWRVGRAWVRTVRCGCVSRTAWCSIRGRSVAGRTGVVSGVSSISLYAQQRPGGSTAAGTAALFVLFLGGAVGSVLGGGLANRWDRVAVSCWSYLVTVAAVAGILFVPGPAIYVFVALTSAGLYVPFSLQVTLGQDYLPSRVGTASGVTLGLGRSASRPVVIGMLGPGQRRHLRAH